MINVKEMPRGFTKDFPIFSENTRTFSFIKGDWYIIRVSGRAAFACEMSKNKWYQAINDERRSYLKQGFFHPLQKTTLISQAEMDEMVGHLKASIVSHFMTGEWVPDFIPPESKGKFKPCGRAPNCVVYYDDNNTAWIRKTLTKNEGGRLMELWKYENDRWNYVGKAITFANAIQDQHTCILKRLLNNNERPDTFRYWLVSPKRTKKNELYQTSLGEIPLECKYYQARKQKNAPESTEDWSVELLLNGKWIKAHERDFDGQDT